LNGLYLALVFSLFSLLSAAVASAQVSADQSAEPEWKADTRHAYLEAEQLLFIERSPNEALIVLNNLLNAEVNPHERSTALLLSAACYASMGDELSAAIATEDSLRALSPIPNASNTTRFIVAIERFKIAGNREGAARIRHYWESIGGDPILLAEEESKVAARSKQFPFTEISGITGTGGTPDPRDLVQSPVPRPTLPQEHQGALDIPTCIVSLSVDTNGHPYDIKPRCDDHILGEAAAMHVSKLRFRVKVERGQRVPRIDMKYPVEFEAAE